MLSCFIVLLLVGNVMAGRTESPCENLPQKDKALDDKIQEYFTNYTAGNELPSSELRLYLFSLIQVRGAENLITLTMRLELSRNDKQLKWKPEKFCGIYTKNSFGIIPRHIKATASADRIRDIKEIEAPVDLTISKSGLINNIIMPRAEVTFTCDMDLNYWPYSVQECIIDMEVSFIQGMMLPELSEVMCKFQRFKTVDPLWELAGCRGEQINQIDTTEYINVQWTYLLVMFPDINMMTLVYPFLLLAFLSPMIFLLKPDADNRTDLSVALLLSAMVALSTVSQVMPNSRQLPAFYYYTVQVLTVIVLEVFCSIALSRIDNKVALKRWCYILFGVFLFAMVAMTSVTGITLLTAPWPDCYQVIGSKDKIENKCDFNGKTYLAPKR